jgi:hypothetical protein
MGKQQFSKEEREFFRPVAVALSFVKSSVAFLFTKVAPVFTKLPAVFLF